jgi:hypothetical protein
VAEAWVVSPETWRLVRALLERPDLAADAARAFRRAYPDAPAPMIETAVHNVFREGVGAALDWVAAAERFLREPGEGLDYGATWHVVYHLYNWQQFQALLPLGRDGMLERLQDMRQFLAEGNAEAAEAVRAQLEQAFRGDGAPPGVG